MGPTARLCRQFPAPPGRDPSRHYVRPSPYMGEASKRVASLPGPPPEPPPEGGGEHGQRGGEWEFQGPLPNLPLKGEASMAKGEASTRPVRKASIRPSRAPSRNS